MPSQIFIQETLISEVTGHANVILLSIGLRFGAQIKPAGLHYGHIENGCLCHIGQKRQCETGRWTSGKGGVLELFVFLVRFLSSCALQCLEAHF